MTATTPSRPTRIYVDVSETLGLGIRTGIQRVVRGIARGQTAVDTRFAIVPVVTVGGKFYRLSPDAYDELVSPAPLNASRVKEGRSTLQGRAAKFLLAPFPRTVKRLQAWRSARIMDRALAACRAGEPVTPGPGDSVVLVDTYFLSGALRAGRSAVRTGAAMICVTYDMTPITHPEGHDESIVRHFVDTVPRGMEASDAVLTISDWCIEEIRRFGITKPIGRFYLGYDIPDVPAEALSDGEKFPKGLWEDGAPVFLMVGTISTRKGHVIALKAFERLWQERSNARLLLIGRPGWEPRLKQRFAEHPELGGRFFVLNDASDALLAEAFRKATAVIQGSAVEGFGLPVVEALARDVPLIASDIPVFREIAGDAALYYPQSDSAALARAVGQMLREREHWARRARDFKWLDWTEAREQFVDECERLARIAGK